MTRRVTTRAAVLATAALVACDGAPPTEDPPEPPPTATPLLEERTGVGLDFVHEHGGVGNRELAETMGGGIALVDPDGDGDLDVYLVQSGPVRKPDGEPGGRQGARNALFLGDGGGRFERSPDGLGAGDEGYGQGVTAGDFDGDGQDDLVVLNWGPNALYRDVGERYALVPDGAGLVRADEWSVSGAFLDADGDGDLDLYVVNYLESPPGVHVQMGLPDGFPGYAHPDRFPGVADRFYVNDDGRFVDRTREAGCHRPSGKGLGVIPTDIELDGNVDFYVANDSTPNFLFRGRGDATFEEIARDAGTAFNDAGQTEAGMGVDTGDVDGDGDLDLFVTNLDGETNTLYANESRDGRVRYRDITRAAGLDAPSRSLVGFGALFADVDRNATLDLLVVNGHVLDNADRLSDLRSYAQPNQLLLGDGEGRFELLPPERAGPGLERPTVSRGSARGDLDGDGALDFVIASNNGAVQLFRGTPPAGPWLALSVRGPAGNPRGVGSSVWLELEDGRRLLRRLESSRSYASSSAPTLVTGLPSPVRAVEVLWPGGRRERWAELPAPFEGARELAHGSGSP